MVLSALSSGAVAVKTCAVEVAVGLATTTGRVLAAELRDAMAEDADADADEAEFTTELMELRTLEAEAEQAEADSVAQADTAELTEARALLADTDAPLITEATLNADADAWETEASTLESEAGMLESTALETRLAGGAVHGAMEVLLSE